MSVTSNSLPVATGRQAVYRALLIANLAIMLFPPIHLAMANGSMTSALVYFLGSPIVLIVSMFLLSAIARRDNPEGAR